MKAQARPLAYPLQLALPKLAAAGGLALGLSLVSASAWANPPVTSAQREAAERTAQAGVALNDLTPDAPERYTVQTGDTLWRISTLFLKSPWRWPELWGMNLQDIANPHLIYPGQVLGLVREGDRARLQLESAGAPSPKASPSEVAPNLPLVKLSPRARVESQDGPIDTIAQAQVQAFANESVLLSANELATSGRIVAAQEGRVLLARGDTAFVRGPVQEGTEYRIFREARPLTSPVSGELLGFEAVHVGTAQVNREDFPPTAAGTDSVTPVRITSSKLEAGVGDRLMALPEMPRLQLSPRPPASAVRGEVVSVYGGSPQAGLNQVVVLSQGLNAGLEPGHVLAVWQAPKTLVDRGEGKAQALTLPGARSGLVLVFRVFDRMAYALMVSGKSPIRRGDRFSQP
jgi:nucleoid-associated protein YgaU